MKLSRRTVLGLASATFLAGCSRVPISGPVVRVSGSPGVTATGGVDIAPAPPAVGATPELILTGFLAASLVPTDNYAAARQFLTPRASTAWVPNASVNVYDSDNHPPVTTDSSALLRAPLLGTIDVRGFYTAGYEPAFEHDFNLVKIGDQWRINAPGDGVFVSRYELHRAYSILSVHYLNRLGSGLVPQQVFIPTRGLSPTTAAQALLRGASPWLRPAVTTAVIDGTGLAAPAVTVDSAGVAEVSLTDQIGSLHDQQRKALAAQFFWTLDDRTPINGLRLEQRGQAFSVPGAGADGVVRAPALADLAPVPDATRRDAYAIVGGTLNRLVTTGFAATGGSWAKGWNHQVQAISLSADGRVVALVADSSTRLFTVRTDSDAQPVPVAEGGALLRPQIDATGTIWVVDRASPGGASMLTVSGGVVTRTTLTGLAAAVPVAARVSPGGERLALVTVQQGLTQLGFLRLRGNPGLVVDGWRALTLVSSLGPLDVLRDVGWISATQLVVLGAVDVSSPAEVFVVDVDGSDVDSLGPGVDMQLSSLAALPTTSGIAMCALTSGGSVLVYQDGSRWQRYGGDSVSAVSYQG